MNLFDLAFLLLALVAVLGGYTVGLMTRLLSWLGLVAGLVLGLRVVPWLLDRTDGAQYELVVAATIAVVVLPAVVGETVGFFLGRRMAPRARHASHIDHLLGGAAGLVAVTAMVWLVLPVLVASPTTIGPSAADSTVARLMTDYLPDPPDIEAALRPIIGDDVFPRVFETLQPPVTVPPPEATGLDPVMAARVATSVVKVEGVACRVTQVGTGFVVGDSLVATNAHVVAGERVTTVERDDGTRLPATVVAFDPGRDLALLNVAAMDRASLALGSSDGGDTGGVFGRPEGEPLRVAPFAVARLVEATGRDIYGDTVVNRDVAELAANLRPGDSGSALIDQAGKVVGVAFAISADQSGVAYALTTSELAAVLRSPHDQPVSTGPCLS